MKERKPISVDQFLKKKEAYALQSEKRKALNSALVKWIIKDNQPLSIVEKPTFKEFMELLDSKYVLPARKTISQQLIPELYAQVEEKLIEILKSVEFLALTTDM